MELGHSDFTQDDLEKDNFSKLAELCRQSMHLLNNRLTTILANTQLTLFMLKDETLRHYLESVEDSAKEAGAIIKAFQESTHSISSSYLEIPDDREENLIQK